MSELASTLVADTEHNVALADMAFRVFLRPLQMRILKNQEIADTLREQLAVLADEAITEPDWYKGLMVEFQEVTLGLQEG